MTTLYGGGCLCAAVRYEAVGPLRDLCICHCTSCRRAVGAPFVPWGTLDRSAFRLTRGALREVSSSEHVLRGFCGACGTSLTYYRTDKPSELDITLATLDDPNALRPECHLWVEDKLSWVSIGDGLPQFARSRSDGAAARAVRPGYTTVSARIVVQDVRGLVEFAREVFGAQGQLTPGQPVELRIGDTTLLISEPGPRAPSSAFLYVYVANVESTHRRALALGARELEAPLNTPYGDRRSMLEDAWGNTWQIARYEAT